MIRRLLSANADPSFSRRDVGPVMVTREEDGNRWVMLCLGNFSLEDRTYSEPIARRAKRVASHSRNINGMIGTNGGCEVLPRLEKGDAPLLAIIRVNYSIIKV